MLRVKSWVTIQITLAMFPRARKTVLPLSKVPREEKEARAGSFTGRKSKRYALSKVEHVFSRGKSGKQNKH